MMNDEYCVSIIVCLTKEQSFQFVHVKKDKPSFHIHSLQLFCYRRKILLLCTFSYSSSLGQLYRRLMNEQFDCFVLDGK